MVIHRQLKNVIITRKDSKKFVANKIYTHTTIGKRNKNYNSLVKGIVISIQILVCHLSCLSLNLKFISRTKLEKMNLLTAARKKKKN